VGAILAPHLHAEPLLNVGCPVYLVFLACDLQSPATILGFDAERGPDETTVACSSAPAPSGTYLSDLTRVMRLKPASRLRNGGSAVRLTSLHVHLHLWRQQETRLSHQHRVIGCKLFTYLPGVTCCRLDLGHHNETKLSLGYCITRSQRYQDLRSPNAEPSPGQSSTLSLLAKVRITFTSSSRLLPSQKDC
jgi:hypothetical protein